MDMEFEGNVGAAVTPKAGQVDVGFCPTRIEFDSERATITVDGVEMSLQLLGQMVRPDASRWLRFERKGNEVRVHTYDPLMEGHWPRGGYR